MKPYWKGLDYVIGIGDREFTVAGVDPLRYMNGEKIGDEERKEVEDELSGVTGLEWREDNDGVEVFFGDETIAFAGKNFIFPLYRTKKFVAILYTHPNECHCGFDTKEEAIDFLKRELS